MPTRDDPRPAWAFPQRDLTVLRTQRNIQTNPISDYTRFGMAVDRHSIPAGDQIHYLDRVAAERPAPFPGFSAA
ncbi:DUF6879 family protein [Streptosporangium sp. NPDC000396]|uniref:DUF6879 family protein n=1 Tax=Streptosporangium sp. NPDC000396 TaxID=3366185 RepID=UPI0036C852F2